MSCAMRWRVPAAQGSGRLDAGPTESLLGLLARVPLRGLGPAVHSWETVRDHLQPLVLEILGSKCLDIKVNPGLCLDVKILWIKIFPQGHH